MDTEAIKNEVLTAINSSKDLSQIHDKVLKLHERAKSNKEYECILEMHKKILDRIEEQLPQNIDKNRFRNARENEYNSMLLRESTIGGSVCVETLYEITQRELEAGRMLPTHEYIEASIHATATSHYTRDQLIRQKNKIQELEEKSTLKKFSKVFKK